MESLSDFSEGSEIVRIRHNGSKVVRISVYMSEVSLPKSVGVRVWE